MSRINPRSLALGAALALLAGLPSSGQAQQYQQYVALGDSLTAGWQSGCLVQRNQVNSFPAMLAHSLYGGDFEQPLVQEGPLTNGTAPKCLGAEFAPPVSIDVVPMSEMYGPLNATLPRPYNNLGMPGAEVADLTTLTSVNPNGSAIERISALVLRNFPTSPFNNTNAVEQAASLLAPAASSAIATLWIGNNNTLGASTSGIVVDGVTLVSQQDFQASYSAIVAGIPPGVQLVVANLPYVTAIPFSTTIPPIVLDANRQPVIVNGSTVPLLGQGDDAYPCVPVAPDHGCPLPPNALVNLSASPLLGQGIGIPTALGGTGLPLPHGSIDATGAHAGVTLYPDEIQLLKERTDQYNSVIANSSGSSAVFVDTNARFSEIQAHGYDVGGIQLTTAFLTGGIFSYDGVHPSTIGYTIVASEFIDAINTQTSSAFPRPNFGDTLFTPNPPDPGIPGSVRGGGPWGYTYGMWSDVLATVTPRASSILLPSVSIPPAVRVVPGGSGRGTRTVSRGVEP